MSRRRLTRACVAVIGVWVLGWVPAWAQEDAELRFSGYYKNLLVNSETWSGEPYALDVNRVRLELKGKLNSALRLDVQYDNEVWLGNYLRTAQFQQQKDLPPQYWNWQGAYADAPALYGTQLLKEGDAPRRVTAALLMMLGLAGIALA